MASLLARTGSLLTLCRLLKCRCCQSNVIVAQKGGFITKAADAPGDPATRRIAMRKCFLRVTLTPRGAGQFSGPFADPWSFLLLVAISWSVLSVLQLRGRCCNLVVDMVFLAKSWSVLQSRGRRCNLVVDMVFVAKSWSVRFLLAKSWLAWICKRPHSQLPRPTHCSSCFCSCSCSY